MALLWLSFKKTSVCVTDHEAGTYKQQIKIGGAQKSHDFGFTAPKVDMEVKAHFILKITYKGKPQLQRYKRVNVTILPK